MLRSEIIELSMDVELAQHLASIRAAMVCGSDVDYPTIYDPKDADAPWQITLLLHRLVTKTSVVEAAGRFLEFQQSPSLRDVTGSSVFRQAMDGEIDEQLVAAVANQLGSSPWDARKHTVRLSCESRLLPSDVVDIVATHVPGADRHRMTKELTDAAGVPRVSVEEVRKMNVLMRSHRLSSQANGREPTIDELAEASGLSAEQIAKIHALASGAVSIGGVNESPGSHYADDDERKSPRIHNRRPGRLVRWHRRGRQGPVECDDPVGGSV